MTSIDEQTPIRERWTGRGPGSGDEETAGALLRLGQRPCPVSDRRLAEIHAHLRTASRAHASRPRSRFRQVAVAAGLILLGAALSASAFELLIGTSHRKTEGAALTVVPRSNPAPRSSADAPKAPEQPAPAAKPEAAAPTASEVSEPVPAAVPRPARVIAARETPGSRRTEPARPEPGLSPPPGPSALAQESRLLASAIAKLRRDGEPGQALAILEQHRAEFGSGALAQEANATRIEALLQLGRNGQALELLDAQTLSARGVAGEMLVARAELRADRARYSAALADFDLLLVARGQSDSVTERARYGRAACRAKSGDWEGARADFQQYLRDFPQGRFADRARRALAPKAR
jgi:hypothetical protein